MRTTLNKKDFFSIYGIFLIAKDKPYLIPELLPLLIGVADKYIKITEYAVRSELRHYNNHDIYCSTRENKIPKNYRKICSLDDVLKLFTHEWEDQYGGKAWYSITKTLIDLKNSVKNKDLWKILEYIDRLNGLEHNSNMYLKGYCSFNLFDALNYKYETKLCSNYIFKWCYPEVRRLRNKSKSITAEWR